MARNAAPLCSALPYANAVGLAIIHNMLTKARATIISDYVIYPLIVVYAVFAALSFFGNQVNLIDESLQLLGGREVLEGRVPHRDFWSMYPPLNFYLNAFVFRIGRQTFMVARFLSAAFYGAALWALCSFLHGQLKTQSPLLRSGAVGLVVFILTRVLTLSQNNTLFAAVLLLVYHASKVHRDGHLTYSALVICGLSSGALLPMRFNYGLYSIASIGSGLVLADEAFARDKLEKRLLRIVAFIAPACVALAAFLIPFGSAAKQVVSQIGRTPNLVLRAGNIYDVSRQLIPYCAISAVVGSGLTCARLNWQNRSERAVAVLLSVLTALFAMIALRFLSKSNLLLVPYVVPAVVISGVLASQIVWKRYSQPVFVALCFLVCSLQHYLIRADGLHLLILAAAASALTATTIVDQPQLARVGAMALLFWLMMMYPIPVDRLSLLPWIVPVNPKSIGPALEVISRRDSFLALGDSKRLMNGQPLSQNERRFFPDSDELAAARYIDRMAWPSDRVFAGLKSHDKTTVNDARLSWIMPRDLASRYLELESGIITSESVQREIIKSMSDGVRWLVLADTATIGVARYPFPRSHVLDQYIASNYRCNVSFGTFTVCCRADACASR